MKVIHVLPRISEEASGPSYSVRRACESLARNGVDVELNVLGRASIAADGFAIRAHSYWESQKSLGWSPAMDRYLREHARSVDVMHTHSLWMMPNVYPAWAANGSRCRLVTAPRGTLAPWALQKSRWRKQIMWWLCQREAVHRADCFHATAEHEIGEIRAAGLCAPVAIIPNGADIPAAPREFNANGSRLKRLLFLGRIAPVKGIDILLRAWRSLQDQFPDWELRIIGRNDAGYTDQMISLAAELKLQRVTIGGPVYGDAKLAELRSADLFVLPTHTENWGNSVSEALSYGVPVIVTKGAPWPGIVTNNCGWWIDRGEAALADCLREALRQPTQLLHEMGLRGREWIERDFSWNRVAERMKQLYEWLLGGGATPSFVSTD